MARDEDGNFLPTWEDYCRGVKNFKENFKKIQEEMAKSNPMEYQTGKTQRIETLKKTLSKTARSLANRGKRNAFL